jgi:hypothetical protein
VLALDAKLKSIGSEAFACTGLRQFDVPKLVEEISNSCFLDCHDLVQLSIPPDSALSRIESRAFEGSDVKSVCLPHTILLQGESALRLSKCEMQFALTKAIFAGPFACDLSPLGYIGAVADRRHNFESKFAQVFCSLKKHGPRNWIGTRHRDPLRRESSRVGPRRRTSGTRPWKVPLHFSARSPVVPFPRLAAEAASQSPLKRLAILENPVVRYTCAKIVVTGPKYSLLGFITYFY